MKINSKQLLFRQLSGDGTIKYYKKTKEQEKDASQEKQPTVIRSFCYLESC